MVLLVILTLTYKIKISNKLIIFFELTMLIYNMKLYSKSL